MTNLKALKDLGEKLGVDCSEATTNAEAIAKIAEGYSSSGSMADTGWVDAVPEPEMTTACTVRCRKYGKVVEVRGSFTLAKLESGSKILTVPAAFRPKGTVSAQAGTPVKSFGIRILNTGSLQLHFATDALALNTQYVISIVYLVEE